MPQLKNKKHLTLILSILIIGSFFAYNIFTKDTQVARAWMNDSYRYRQIATVTNNTGVIQSGYQLKISLDTATMITASQLQSDCDDLRFTNISGVELPYWIESGCNSATTKIWVKADRVPVGSSTIYVYYGNSTAASAQNGDATFELFDDFLSPNINNSKWDVAVKGTGGTIGVTSSGEATLSPTPLTISSVSIKSKKTFTNNVAIEAKRKLASATIYFDFSLGGGNVANQNANQTDWWHTDLGNGYTWWSNGAASNNIALADSAGGITNLVGSAFAVDGPLTTYQRFQYIYDSAGGLWWFTNDSYKGSATNTANLSNSKFILLSQGEHTSGNGDTQSVDWVFVRKIAGTPTVSEPSVGSFGTAETGEAPVAYWKFDEGQGVTTFDESVSGNDGAITGASWKTEDDCKIGKCLSFDGSGDYVSTPNAIASSTLNFGTSDFTISAWVKPNATAGYLTVIAKGGQGVANTWSFMINSGALRWSGASNDFSSVGSQFIIGQWYHIVASIDVGGNAVLYKNGEQIKTQAWTTVNLSNNYAFYIGNESYSGAQSFNGSIDEVKVYPYARTASQVKKDYAAGRLKNSGTGSGVGVSAGEEVQSYKTEGLVGHWKMDETTWNGTASEVIDSSGVGNHGTETSASTSGTAKYGRSGDFDGTNSYIDVGSPDSLQFTSANFSVSAWFKPSNATARQPIIGRGNHYNNNGTGWLLSYYGDAVGDPLNFFINNGSGLEISGGPTVGDISGAWHLATVTVERTGNATIYLDGVSRGTVNVSGKNGTIANTSLVIGQAASNTGSRFLGGIDDVRIYNRVLSAAEIRRLYADAPPPVLHLRMDEGTGQYAYDNSGRSATGTLGASATASTDDPTWASASTCKFGGCLSFDGTADYVSIPATTLSPTNSTIEFWFKSGAATQMMAGKSSGNNSYIRFYSTTIFTMGSEDGTYAEFDVTPAMSLNTWYHAAITQNNNTARLYLNGIEAFTGGAAKTSATILDEIGKRGAGGAGNQWYGWFDDVRIYDYARSATQIREDMLAGAPVVTSPRYSVAPNAPNSSTNSSGMVAYWKFDEGTTSTYAYDATANGNDGTYVGSVSSTPGKFGRAADFDGVSGYIGKTSPTFIDDTQGTASFWIKTNNLTVTQEMITISQGTGSGMDEIRLTLLNGNVLQFNFVLDGSNSFICSTVANTIGDKNWHFVTFTSNGSVVLVYVDGVSKTCAATTGSNSGQWFNSATDAALFTIGVLRRNVNYSYFDGKIDEAKIYNIALTADEIKADYNKGKAMMLGAPSSEDSVAATGSGDRPAQSSAGGKLVGWWKMDEKSGQYARDYSGHSNNGTLGASATASTDDPSWKSAASCHSGSCLSLDGTADYLEVLDRTSLRFGVGNFSIAAWIKTTDASSPIVDKYGAGGGGGQYQFAVSSGKLRGFIWNATYGPNITADTTITDNKWHHAVMVIDSNGTSGRIYLDGKQDGSTTGATATNSDSSGTLRIGNNSNGSVIFAGSIDDVKIWNYALSSAEIAYEYNRGKPVAHWKFDEGQGELAYDSSVSGSENYLYVSPGRGGTQTATSTMWTAATSSKFNGGLSFDGTDDWAEKSTFQNPTVSLSGDMSMSAWFNTTNAQSGQARIFSTLQSGGSGGLQICMASGKFIMENAGGPTNSITEPVAKNDGLWHHIVFVRSSTTYYFYSDGKLIGTTPGTVVTYVGATMGQLTRIAWYSGKIDDARIYNYALSPAQIREVYNNGKSVYFK